MVLFATTIFSSIKKAYTRSVKKTILKLKNNKGQILVGEYYKNTSDTLIIYCHGTHSFSLFPQIAPFFEAYYALGLSFFWFDFSGYGNSEGNKKADNRQRVSEIGTAVSYFSPHYSRIILAGISLGAVAAAIAAIEYKEVSKVYFINGLFELKLIYPWFLPLLLWNILRSSDFRQDISYVWKHLDLKRMQKPTLFVVGKKDLIVNPLQSYRCFNRLTTQKKMIEFPDGDHSLLDKKYIYQNYNDFKNWFFEKNTQEAT